MPPSKPPRSRSASAALPWWFDGAPDLNRKKAKEHALCRRRMKRLAAPPAQGIVIDPLPLLIGTAGWSIPAADAASFPASGTHLERYATTMSAVEINSSFHRPHRRSTYERWAASTPERFRFSVKIPKAISHVRRLVDADELLVSFVEQIEGLADRLSVLLLQLPPSLAFAAGVASSFFGALRHKVSPDTGIACEPPRLPLLL